MTAAAFARAGLLHVVGASVMLAVGAGDLGALAAGLRRDAGASAVVAAAPVVALMLGYVLLLATAGPAGQSS